MASSGKGRTSGRIASANRAITWASSASVLAPLARRLRVVANLRRVHDHGRKTQSRQAVDHQAFIAPRRLKGDKGDLLATQLIRERCETGFRPVNR